MPLTSSLRGCLATLAASHTRFHQTEADSIEREIFRHAIIKGFGLARELVHKLLLRPLLAHGHDRRRQDETPVRDILRLAATLGRPAMPCQPRTANNPSTTAHQAWAMFFGL